MEKISLSSIAIVIINFLVACSRFNNTDVVSIDLCGFNFQILIFPLLFNSIDIFKAHKDYTSGCIKVERTVSFLSLVLSAFIIGLAVGSWCEFWNIENGTIQFLGRLSEIHTTTNTETLGLGFVMDLYFVSCIFQLLARLFKFKIDRDIKKEILQ